MVRRCEGAKVVLNFTWRPLREGFYHDTVARGTKVDTRSGMRCGLSVLCVMSSSQPRSARRVRGIFFAHATTAKDAKVNKKRTI